MVLSDRNIFKTILTMNPYGLVTVFLAEFTGTAMLLFLGCAGCLHWAGPPSLLQIALNFGLVVMLVIQIFGCVSGGHLNPVVTIAAFIFKIVSLSKAAVYIVAQSLGAFAGFGLLKLLTPRRVFEKSSAIGSGNCMIRPNPEMKIGQSLAIEYIATTCLVLICCGVWDKRNTQFMDSLTLRFGLALTALVVILVSLNEPKRSFLELLHYCLLQLESIWSMLKSCAVPRAGFVAWRPY